VDTTRVTFYGTSASNEAKSVTTITTEDWRRVLSLDVDGGTQPGGAILLPGQTGVSNYAIPSRAI